MPTCKIDNKQGDKLWGEHLASPTVETRNALLLHYQPLCVSIAFMLGKTMPAHSTVLVDDLQSEAVAGMAKLIDSGRFDPARGVKFQTYATLRVRGYLLDIIRELDWVPRLERLKEKRGEVNPRTMYSFDLRQSRGETRNESEYDFDTSDDAEPVSARQDRQDFWREMLQSCSKVERLIVLLYYREGLRMKQVGVSLGLSESRISQIHKDLLVRLRGQVAV